MFQKQRKSGGGDFGIAPSETLPGLGSIKKPSQKSKEKAAKSLKAQEKKERTDRMMQNATTTLVDQVAGICGCF